MKEKNPRLDACLHIYMIFYMIFYMYKLSVLLGLRLC